MMRKLQKNGIALSIATALLLTGVALPSIHTAEASEQKQEVQAINIKHQATLNNIKKLAFQGKTINSENFGLHSKASDIEKKWGKPDYQSKGALTYKKRGMDFDLRFGKVVKIYSTDKSYQSITYQEVKQTLGKPVKETKAGDGYYITYRAGKNTLELAFTYNKDRTGPAKFVAVNVF